MEVCGDDGEEGMGDVGLEVTSWEMMRVYAWTAEYMRQTRPRRQDRQAYLCDSLDEARDGEHTFVHAGDDLADAGLDTGLVAQVGDIFASLADDNASVLGADQGT